jgi:hypothetical protein
MPFELDSPNDEFPLVVWRKKKKGQKKRDRHLIVDTYLSSVYQFGNQRLMEI